MVSRNIFIFSPVEAIDRSSVENFEAVRAYPDLMLVHLDVHQGRPDPRDHQNSDVVPFPASVVFLDFPSNDLKINLWFLIHGFITYPFQLVHHPVEVVTLDLDLVYPVWVDFVALPLVESIRPSVVQVRAM